ncbi:diacylglycerol/lipid kinase family protein [Sediminivirga luteola]|uniref:diacylglycerol/lipid kinase family protein n=1 Tax=Sediminivirga luteola TaxID=1774748 RepID=UPI001F584716|nr:diacylglycerol kinase family protein [Sediminivirga luteola]MCI2264371.1 NAD(+)/NADH kinase [Sediminivirga luteola]
MAVELDLLLLILLGLLVFGLGAGTTALLARRIRLRAVSEATQAAQADARHDNAAQAEAAAMPRAALIVNPTKAGARTLPADAEAIMRQEGWAAPLVLETDAEDAGTSAALSALDANVDLVIAAGGDGTVRAVAQALAGTEVPLGIVPMGTGNLLARNLDQHRLRRDQSIRTALWGRNRRIDVAQLALDDSDQVHAFLVMAGFGFDADVMANTDAELKSRLGWLAYFEAGSRKLGGKPSQVSLRLDDGPTLQLRVRTVVGGNCGKIQGGIELMPDARIDDGRLDILTVSAKNIGDWVAVAARFLGRNRIRLPQVNMHQCRTATVESEDVLEVQLDGDPIGTAQRLRMWIEPDALLVRVPTEEQLRLIRQESWRLALPKSER